VLSQERSVLRVESGEERAACVLSQERSVLRVESGEERAACVPFFDTGEGQGDAYQLNARASPPTTLNTPLIHP
jgi:hypothetical protein